MTAPISLVCLREVCLCECIVLEVEWYNGPCVNSFMPCGGFEEYDNDFAKE
jgi:hypothetical protein